jgi:hypothetical protein
MAHYTPEELADIEEENDELRMEVSAITQQRDELLAALQAVATWWYGTPSASPESRYGENASGVYVQVFTAIDKGGGAE